MSGRIVPEKCARRLAPGTLGLVPVVLDVQFRGFRAVVCGVLQMSVRRMGVVRRGFVIPAFVMACRFAVMLRGVLMVLRRFVMMLRCLLRHDASSQGDFPCRARRRN